MEPAKKISLKTVNRKLFKKINSVLFWNYNAVMKFGETCV